MNHEPDQRPDFESTSIVYQGEIYTFIERDKLNRSELADALGYSLRLMSEMKAAGCPFFGRFSTVQIVRKWEYKNPSWRKE